MYITWFAKHLIFQILANTLFISLHFNLISVINIYYTVSQKKWATIAMDIIVSTLDGFAKFFRCCKDR